MKKLTRITFLSLCAVIVIFSKTLGQEYYFKTLIGEPSLNGISDLAIDAKGCVYVLSDGGYIIKLDSTGKFVTFILTPGTENGQLNLPSSFIIDTQNNIWIADTGNDRIQKFDASGKFLMKFGSFGTENGQLNNPTGISVDREGNVYVTDTNNNRIQKFNSFGQFISKFSIPESEGGGAYPSFSDISIDLQNNLLVIDSANDIVYKFDSVGNFIIKFGNSGSLNGEFDYPSDIVVDNQNNIYITDTFNNCIQKFDSNGRFISKWISAPEKDREVNHPYSIAISEKGDLWMGDGKLDGKVNRLQNFDSTGQLIRKFDSFGTANGQFQYPFGVAVNMQGDIFVSDKDNHRIQKFGSNGQFVNKFGTYGGGNGEFSSPAGIAIDRQNNIYVADYNNNRIQKFDANGKFITIFGSFGTGNGKLIQPFNIALDSQNNLFAVDSSNRRIRKFDASGKFLNQIGSFGTENGQFQFVAGIAVDSQGNLFVVENSSSRVQKFDNTGRFIKKFNLSGNADVQQSNPFGIAIDALTNIYIADVTTNSVQKFDADGNLLFKMNVPTPSTIATDKYGNIYCSTDLGLLFYQTNRIPAVIGGTIFSDENQNCTFDTFDKLLPNVLVAVQPGNYYSITDTTGKYYIPVDTGTYTVSQVINNDKGRVLQPTCPANNMSPKITFRTIGDSATNINFANKATLLSHLLVNISSNRRRRCFSNSTTVNYINTGYADAQNAKVYVNLPKHVVFKSADKPYVIDKDSNYVFTIGTLKANESGAIRITDSVACQRNIAGLTACTKVWITPFNSYTLPPNLPWDNSDMTLQGKCIENGRVRLAIKNSGQGGMADSAEFGIFLDAQLALRKNFKLAKGDSLVFKVPANGKTVRLEAFQRPGHPRKSQTNLTLEGCVASASEIVSKGFVNALPQDDTESEVAIDCQPIIDSFDPNDKQVSPQGTTTQHYTPTDSELKYLIRFQNTGTDTAYTVIVIDTLSEQLDIATLQVGAASHKYSFNVSGKGRPVLTWAFNNINMPDSTRNQLASNGFIQFSIKPKANLPEKTRIENFADIIFDYNDPIRTNVTTNVLYDVPPVVENSVRISELEVVLGSEQPQWSHRITIYPNPSDGRLTVDVSEAGMPIQHMEVFNSLGQKIVSRKLLKPTLKEELDLAGNGAGLYMIVLKTNQGNATRKIILK